MQSSGSAPQFNSGQVSNNQSSYNVNSAIDATRLNNVNQVTPQGSLTYGQTGGEYDYNGNFVPSYTATQTLSPEQQGLYTASTGLQQGALGAAQGRLGALNSTLGAPTPDSATIRNQAYDALTARSTEDLTRSRNAQQVQLANQGIQPGSEAWSRAMEGQDRAVTDASNQATINAGTIAGQNLQQDQSIRNQSINEFASLLGLGTGTSPNYINTPQTQVQAPDATSPAIAGYQGQLNAYNQQMQSGNAAMGGLFGLGGSVLGGLARNPQTLAMLGLV